MKPEPLTNEFLISLACPWAAPQHFDGCDKDHEDRERQEAERDSNTQNQ